MMSEIAGVINNSTGQLVVVLHKYRENFYDSPEFYADLIRTEKQYGDYGQYEIAMICFDGFEMYVSSENYTFIYKNKENSKASDTGQIFNALTSFKLSVESAQIQARKHLNKQSDYGGYHGGVNNTCNDVLAWIESLVSEDAE